MISEVGEREADQGGKSLRTLEKMNLKVRFRWTWEPENGGAKTTGGDETSPRATACRRSHIQAHVRVWILLEVRCSQVTISAPRAGKEQKESLGPYCLCTCLKELGRDVEISA